MNEAAAGPKWWSATIAWRFLRCRASASPAWEPVAPSRHPADNAGTVAHFAVQAWAENGEWSQPNPGVSLQERFDEATASAGIEQGRLTNAVITRARLKTRGGELAELFARTGGQIRSEMLLTDDENHLFGILDLAALGAGGLVIDIKTGREVASSPGIKHQMTFYAHLFAVAHGTLPARVIVFSLQRGPEEIKVRHSDIIALLSDIQSARLATNRVAAPAPESCRFCPKRMTCEPHWDALPNWTNPDAIEGSVDRIERSTSGATALLIDDNWLTGLLSDQFLSDIRPGQRVRAVRVRRRGDTSPEEWEATRSTRIRLAPDQ